MGSLSCWVPFFITIVCVAHGHGPVGGKGLGSTDDAPRQRTFWPVCAGSLVIIICIAIVLLQRTPDTSSPVPDAERHIIQAFDTYCADYGTLQDSGSFPIPDGLPSGIWRVIEHRCGSGHGLRDLDLLFELNTGQVSGSGVDDIGRYKIEGIFDSQFGSSIAFRKKYTRGSLNDHGIAHPENTGHEVEYHATRAGPSLGQGFRGTWYMKLSDFQGDGKFDLWPMKCDRASASDCADPEKMQGPAFKVKKRFSCVICFKNPVNTSLMPCGHIAACSECIHKLAQPKTCPICCDFITHLAGPDGSIQGETNMYTAVP